MQYLGKVYQCRLARPVAQRLGKAAIASDAGHEGDAAARPEVGQDGRSQAHGTGEINRDNALGNGQVELIGAHRHVVAGQIDDKIDSAPGFKQVPAGRSQTGRVGRIAGQQQGIGDTQCRELVGLAGRQGQPGSATGQFARDRGADTGRSTNQPDALVVPVGNLRVHLLTKVSVTSPRLKPHFDIQERFIITLSSIRNIQSSKSTLYILPSTGSAST